MKKIPFLLLFLLFFISCVPGGGAIEDMPRYASKVGMKEILSARKIILGVFRPWHRAVVRRACCGEVSASFPVTLLQNHPDATILVNDVAAEKAVE